MEHSSGWWVIYRVTPIIRSLSLDVVQSNSHNPVPLTGPASSSPSHTLGGVLTLGSRPCSSRTVSSPRRPSMSSSTSWLSTKAI